MSVQRWDVDFRITSPDGEFVTYADHVAAVAEAEQRVLTEVAARTDYVYEQGYAAALDRAREAVRNTPTDPRWNILQIERAFLAAIDALKGEQA